MAAVGPGVGESLGRFVSRLRGVERPGCLPAPSLVAPFLEIGEGKETRRVLVPNLLLVPDIPRGRPGSQKRLEHGLGIFAPQKPFGLFGLLPIGNEWGIPVPNKKGRLERRRAVEAEPDFVKGFWNKLGNFVVPLANKSEDRGLDTTDRPDASLPAKGGRRKTKGRGAGAVHSKKPIRLAASIRRLGEPLAVGNGAHGVPSLGEAARRVALRPEAQSLLGAGHARSQPKSPPAMPEDLPPDEFSLAAGVAGVDDDIGLLVKPLENRKLFPAPFLDGRLKLEVFGDHREDFPSPAGPVVAVAGRRGELEKVAPRPRNEAAGKGEIAASIGAGPQNSAQIAGDGRFLANNQNFFGGAKKRAGRRWHNGGFIRRDGKKGKGLSTPERRNLPDPAQIIPRKG